MGYHKHKLGNSKKPHKANATNTLLDCSTAPTGGTAPALQPGGRLPHDYKFASLFASVAGWSYSNISDFEDMLVSDKTDVMDFSDGDFVQIDIRNKVMYILATAQMIRTNDQKTVIICFRGTEPDNVFNWITDLATSTVTMKNTKTNQNLDKNIEVHSGFYRNLEAIWEGPHGILAHLEDPSLLNSEEEDDSNGKKTRTRTDSSPSTSPAIQNIYLTGHSLGAAMAMLAGLELALQGGHLWQKVRGIYTYGQPMVIKPDSVRDTIELLQDKLYRHVYHNDVVPHVPPVTMGLFAHVGTEYRYNFAGLKFWKDDEWEETRAGDTVTQLVVGTPTIPFIMVDAAQRALPWIIFHSPWSMIDHGPLGYINSLKTKVDKIESAA